MKKDTRNKVNSNPKKRNRCVYVLLREGKVVYIGMTMNLPLRLTDHKCQAKGVWDDYKVLADKLTYKQAHEMEKMLIELISLHTDTPIFNNSKHNKHNRFNRYAKFKTIEY